MVPCRASQGLVATASRAVPSPHSLPATVAPNRKAGYIPAAKRTQSEAAISLLSLPLLGEVLVSGGVIPIPREPGSECRSLWPVVMVTMRWELFLIHTCDSSAQKCASRSASYWGRILPSPPLLTLETTACKQQTVTMVTAEC